MHKSRACTNALKYTILGHVQVLRSIQFLGMYKFMEVQGSRPCALHIMQVHGSIGYVYRLYVYGYVCMGMCVGYVCRVRV